MEQVAKEMGYFPNWAAKSLKTNRTYNLGILFSDESNCVWPANRVSMYARIKGATPLASFCTICSLI